MKSLLIFGIKKHSLETKSKIGDDERYQKEYNEGEGVFILGFTVS